MSDETFSGGATSRRLRLARDQLVRIDSNGVVSAAGRAAAGRLRSREGAFRMLPSPDHVVFLRLTGEDGRRDEEDGAVVRLAGEVTAPGVLCDILGLVAQSGWRGELVIYDGEHTRSIFFDQGNIVGAQTSAEAERIGMILWRHGLLDADQHAKVMEKVKEGARFGQTAVDLGYLTREQLFTYIGKQLEEILFPTFAIADGAYYFLDDFDDARLVARHAASATGLLMDGLARMDEIRYFRQKIPGSDFIPARTDRGEPPADLRPTWSAIDGHATVEEIGRKTGRGDFTTTKEIYALLQARFAVLHPPRTSGGAAALVTRANAALRLLHQRADAAGKGTALREGLRHYLVTTEGYGPLLESGADEDGTLDPPSVVAGASREEEVDPEQRLKTLLHEYVAFALFSVGGLLGASQEASLTEEIDPILQEILPRG
jgi:hypothetical protein